MMRHNTVRDIRAEFAMLLHNEQFTSTNREATMNALVGSRTVEIIGANLVADQDVLFGTMNWDYVRREEEWYRSTSRNVNDFPGGPASIWQAIAAKDGTINSNYGWTVFSSENGSQFDQVIKELKKNPESRRAVAIYTRPSMWLEYNWEGRSDFMCTNVVQYVVRDGKAHAVVQMRSNDAITGYKNDRAWQQTVLEEVASHLGLPAGNLYWQVGSLHVYERHFYLVDHYQKAGELTISKEDYKNRYPDSPYAK